MNSEHFLSTEISEREDNRESLQSESSTQEPMTNFLLIKGSRVRVPPGSPDFQSLSIHVAHGEQLTDEVKCSRNEHFLSTESLLRGIFRAPTNLHVEEDFQFILKAVVDGVIAVSVADLPELEVPRHGRDELIRSGKGRESGRHRQLKYSAAMFLAPCGKFVYECDDASYGRADVGFPSVPLMVEIGFCPVTRAVSGIEQCWFAVVPYDDEPKVYLFHGEEQYRVRVQERHDALMNRLHALQREMFKTDPLAGGAA